MGVCPQAGSDPSKQICRIPPAGICSSNSSGSRSAAIAGCTPQPRRSACRIAPAVSRAHACGPASDRRENHVMPVKLLRLHLEGSAVPSGPSCAREGPAPQKRASATRGPLQRPCGVYVNIKYTLMRFTSCLGLPDSDLWAGEGGLRFAWKRLTKLQGHGSYSLLHTLNRSIARIPESRRGCSGCRARLPGCRQLAAHAGAFTFYHHMRPPLIHNCEGTWRLYGGRWGLVGQPVVSQLGLPEQHKGASAALGGQAKDLLALVCCRPGDSRVTGLQGEIQADLGRRIGARDGILGARRHHWGHRLRRNAAHEALLGYGRRAVGRPGRARNCSAHVGVCLCEACVEADSCPGAGG